MATWTTDQKKVINRRGENILVSAAAGSGKTAVLVERILQKITDEKHPVDVDKLIVVTFTNAAAGEMRERIRDALNKKLKDAKPGRERQNLERQKTLLSHSKICTIDSFCGYIVKNHFEEIGFEPAYRLMDNDAREVFLNESMDEFLLTKYEEGRPEFYDLVKTYGKKNKDLEIQKMILDIVNEADCTTRPYEWLEKAGRNYEDLTAENLSKQDWAVAYLASEKQLFSDLADTILELSDLAMEDEEAAKDVLTYKNDYDFVMGIAEAPDFVEFVRRLTEGKFSTAPRKGKENQEYRLELRAVREKYKKKVSALSKLFSGGLDALIESMKEVAPYVEELIRLSTEFHHFLDEKKKDENAYDFSDIEHAAYEILVDSDGNPTQIALQFAREFDEVMVDEYQDSNDLQEAILSSVTGEKLERHNYFMVGDVKQSIYRFRQARPSIFMNKLHSFSDEEGDNEKILLKKNFRSRSEVTNCVNSVFRRIMLEDLGKILYDEDHYLYPGANYLAPDHNEFQPEFLIGDYDSMPNSDGKSDSNDTQKFTSDASDEEDLGKAEFEGRMIATKILKLLQTGHVMERKSDEEMFYRPVQKRDIAILVRSIREPEQVISDILTEYGIDNHIENKKGYYSTNEVECVLSFLEILENPLQDIPMAAVLHSPMFSATEDDLAEIRIEYHEEPFSKGVMHYGEDHIEEAEDKIVKFYHFYTALRQDMPDMTLHDLILRILNETGYQLYVRAIPGGDVRSANLDKLVDLAIAFERSGRQGIYAFVEHIRRLKKFNVESGNAELVSEEDDCVKIMTIHGSKGLEFPIVFLSNLSKQFNTQYTKNILHVNQDYGLALREVKGRFHISKKNVCDKAFDHLTMQENLGEELRVLYVAMTRAKEKLIFTAVPASTELPEEIPERLSYTDRLNAKNYFQWLIKSLGPDSGVKKSIVTYTDLLEGMDYDTETENMSRDRILALLSEPSDALNFFYENLEREERKENLYKNKYSVSEIKHQAMRMNYQVEDAEEEPEKMGFLKQTPKFLEEEKKKTIPGFLLQNDEASEDSEKGDVNQGALRGTAMHRVMELLEFTDDDILAEDGILRAVNQMTTQGRLRGDERELIQLPKISQFTRSEIFLRMKKADQEGMLKKEAPFVMGETENDLFQTGSENKNLILVQGIIDAYFIEDGKMILVDYKTDRVRAGEELVLRYKKQMELYADALEKAFHLPVKEAILYSFSLGEEVVIPFLMS